MGASIRFVGTSADGLPLKRKQVSQACEHCRKRKKRCIHALEDTEQVTPFRSRQTSSPILDRANAIEPIRKRPRTALPDELADAAARLLEFAQEERRHSQDSPYTEDPRFIGYSNPEGILLEATRSPDSKPHDIGVWADDAPTATPGTTSLERLDIQSPELRAGDLAPRIVSLDPFCRRDTANNETCLIGEIQENNWTVEKILPNWVALRNGMVSLRLEAVLPRDEHWRALRRIFIDKIQPIFPVFPQAQLQTLGDGDASRTGHALKAAVCIATATQPSAASHLVDYMGQPLSPAEYIDHVGSRFLDYTRTMESDPTYSTLGRIRAHILVSLFYQPLDTIERNASARLFATAVHDAQGIALHSEVFETRLPDEDGSALFLALWIADRLHSAMSGRPVLIHTSDLGRDILQTIEAQTQPCFRVLGAIAWQLHLVIDLYRPRQGPSGSIERQGPGDSTDLASASVRKIEFPLFESLCIDCGATTQYTSFLTSLEVLYHAVAILSVHLPKVTDTQINTKAHLPDLTVNPRRSVAADRICSALRDRNDTVAMPWSPYAATLALTVYYLKMRYSQLRMYRDRGRSAFLSTVELLDQMGTTWTRSKMMADRGRDVDDILEKAQNNCRQRDHGVLLRQASHSKALDQDPGPPPSLSDEEPLQHHNEQVEDPMNHESIDESLLTADMQYVDVLGAQAPEMTAAPLEPVDWFGWLDDEDLLRVNQAFGCTLDLSQPQF